MYKLQDVNLKPIIGNEVLSDMYYRSNKATVLIKNDSECVFIKKNTFIETFTYYGALSIEKWKKYTYVQNIYLVLEVEGNFEITLFGHYIENKVIKKEYLGKILYEIPEKKTIIIPYPIDFRSQLIAFSIETKSKVKVYSAYYASDLEVDINNKVYISLVTTTFKKENYINKNIRILTKELFEKEEFQDKFVWHIIDNGRTLEPRQYSNISIIHNKNVGGAGGFAKGMIDSLRQNIKPTHILLMDDDVNVSSESFKRLYRLLNILRPEYADYFISGAMLNMDAPNIQHENTGRLVEEGYCVPMHSGRDLRLWDQIIWNEEIDESIKNRYAAWWFCCIPTTVASLDNLPLPVFVRGDDMEYSIRNHAKFITMNGISIWHQGFAGKFNAPMDFYQSKRNELIVFTTRPELEKVDSFRAIEELFWHQMYKFDYIGAEYLIDTVDDYMKGPEWFSSNNLFLEIQKRRNKDNIPQKITDDIRNNISYDELYEHKKTNRLIKFIYDYTYNGQARIPEFLLPKTVGIIPYDFGYYPSKQLLTKVNYAVSITNDTYVIFEKDRMKFKKLKKRWNKVKKEYLMKKNDLKNTYRNFEKRITNVEFWDAYLK